VLTSRRTLRAEKHAASARQNRLRKQPPSTRLGCDVVQKNGPNRAGRAESGNSLRPLARGAPLSRKTARIGPPEPIAETASVHPLGVRRCHEKRPESGRQDRLLKKPPSTRPGATFSRKTARIGPPEPIAETASVHSPGGRRCPEKRPESGRQGRERKQPPSPRLGCDVVPKNGPNRPGKTDC
jgi:hypothetical protein